MAYNLSDVGLGAILLPTNSPLGLHSAHAVAAASVSSYTEPKESTRASILDKHNERCGASLYDSPVGVTLEITDNGLNRFNII